MNGVLRRHFGKEMTNERVFRLHNVTDKEAWKFSTEAWVLKIGDKEKLETAQMRFLRQFLGITKLDRERNKFVREKSGVQDIVRKIQQCQQKRYNTYRKWIQTGYLNRYCSINLKGRET
jgi:hypothetical protein